MNSVTFNIFIEGGTDEEGSYTAWCPSLPGCYSVGRTPEEARTRMSEAMGLHLATLLEYEENGIKTSSAAEAVRLEELEFTIAAPLPHDPSYNRVG